MDSPNAENLHSLRKRIKYHWYHLRLLKDIWPSAMKPLLRQADSIADRLGEDHDLAVLDQTITNNRESFGEEDAVNAFLGLVRMHRKRL